MLVVYILLAYIGWVHGMPPLYHFIWIVGFVSWLLSDA